MNKTLINNFVKNWNLKNSDIFKKYYHEKGSVYILILQKNKLYVGYSENVKKRISDHFTSPKVNFLKIYKPLEEIIINNVCIRYESRLTTLLMKEFGWDNVRGGGWTKTKINKPAILELENNLKKKKNVPPWKKYRQMFLDSFKK